MSTTPFRRDGRAALVASLTLLAGAGAMAQTPGCDKFRADMAERMSAKGGGPVTIESVKADEPLPPGARVVGNCSGGTWKVVLRRGVAAATSPAASAPTAPGVKGGQASTERSAPPPAPPPSTPAETVRAPAAASVALPSAAPAPASSAPARAATIDPPASSTKAAATGLVPAPTMAVPVERNPPATAGPAAPRDAALWPPTRPWLLVAGGAGGLLVLVLLWRWVRYRLAYDAQGLPRGPRLN